MEITLLGFTTTPPPPSLVLSAVRSRPTSLRTPAYLHLLRSCRLTSTAVYSTEYLLGTASMPWVMLQLLNRAPADLRLPACQRTHFPPSSEERGSRGPAWRRQCITRTAEMERVSPSMSAYLILRNSKQHPCGQVTMLVGSGRSGCVLRTRAPVHSPARSRLARLEHLIRRVRT